MAPDYYIYKTKPGYFFIFFMIIGGVFSAFIIHLFWPFFEFGTATIKIFVFVSSALFILILGCSIWSIIGFKIFYLTQNELIIVRPFLRYKRHIPLSDIGRMSESDESISVRGGWSYEKMVIGRKAAYNLSNEKKLTIRSVEIWGYNSLIKKLDTQIRVNKDRQISKHYKTA